MKQRQGARRAGPGLRMVPVPRDEAGRMAAVGRYEILATPPDGAFDRVAALAGRRGTARITKPAGPPGPHSPSAAGTRHQSRNGQSAPDPCRYTRPSR